MVKRRVWVEYYVYERGGRNLPEMEKIKNSVGIDSYRSTNGRWIRLVADRVGEVANWGRSHGSSLITILILGDERRLPTSAPNPLGDIYAGLGGVAGLAGVKPGLGIGAVRVSPLPLRRMSGGRRSG